MCGGPATRRPQPGPAFHFAGQVFTAHLAGSVELDPAERVVLWSPEGSREGGLMVRRLGATIGLRQAWPLERGWELEAGLSAGARVHLFADIQAPFAHDAALMPTASARARAWAPPAPGQRLRLGGGVMVSHDGLQWERAYPTELTGRLRPLTVAVEVGVLRP